MANQIKCDGCSGELEKTAKPRLWKCTVCSGLISIRPIELVKALKIVNFREFEGRNDPDYTRYFSLMVLYPDGDVRRVHGWFNIVTGKATQIG